MQMAGLEPFVAQRLTALFWPVLSPHLSVVYLQFTVSGCKCQRTALTSSEDTEVVALCLCFSVSRKKQKIMTFYWTIPVVVCTLDAPLHVLLI